jgi:hypothetical protein
MTAPSSVKAPQRFRKLTPIIVRDKPLAVGGLPAVTVAEADAQLLVARERYAQVGVNLTWSTSAIHDLPTGVDLEDGLKVMEVGSTTLATNMGMGNAWLKKQGLISLKEQWSRMHYPA